MKALVTGGGGFLGSAIARMLRERGDQVTSFARGAYPELEASGVAVVRGDLDDREAVAAACAGADVVFHVAARAGLAGPHKEYVRTNVGGTAHVIDACRRHRVPRLVYTSSPSVVFDGRDMEGVDESVEYPARWIASYPETKARAERMVLAASSPDLAVVSLRPHCIWGPGDNHLVPRIVARARAGRLRRVGAGGKRVDATYVDNAARAHLLAADRLAPGAPIAGRAYFIAQGQPVETWEFIDRILACAGLPPVRASVPAGVAYAAGAAAEAVWRLFALPGEPPMTRFLASELSTSHWFDLSAARRDLGYEATVGIDEGLARLARWIAGGGLARA
jgi:nucleoside-diphosphate-sugar epimerase